MFSFNRKEQIVLLCLGGALLIGTAVNLIERYGMRDLPDFQVKKEEIPLPVEGSAALDKSATKTTSGPVDLNRATAKQLTNLPGIGPKTAQQIVDHRDRHGPFKTIEDLTAVKGIGPKTLERLRPRITVNRP